MSKKILLTGSNGYLGGEVLSLLKKSNYEILLINKNENSSSSRKTLISDISNFESVKKISPYLKDVNILIHLAAKVPRNKNEDESLSSINNNIIGTANLLSFLPSVSHIIYASTIEVYGLGNFKLINEDAQTYPNTYYGSTKLASENIIQTFGSKNSIPISILRFSSIYGPLDPINRAIPNFIKQSLNNEEISVYGPMDIRDFVHIEDAANSIVNALEKKSDGVYNIGSGKGISILKVAKIISKTINGNKKVHLKPNKKEKTAMVLDINKAQKELGYSPKYIFPDGLENIIKSYNK